MILRDEEIETLANGGMISNFDGKKLSNCRYNLRAHRAFSPQTGAEQVIEPPGTPGVLRREVGWAIKPTETLVVMTKESVNLPANVMATYGQLNRLAQKGISLINTSIVEPGYSGPLSCFLVNFSKETVYIHPGDPVAKMCFMQLTGAPKKLEPANVTEEEYERTLADVAQRYPVSLMDIGGLEERVAEHIGKNVNKSITLGGVIVVVLIAWATFEPLISRWLWEKIGVVTITQRQEIQNMQNELKTAQLQLEQARKELEAERHLREIERAAAEAKSKGK